MKHLLIPVLFLLLSLFTACAQSNQNAESAKIEESIQTPAVTELDLSSQPEESLKVLEQYPSLELLDISGMELTSVEPLKVLVCLNTLDARDTKMTAAMYEELNYALPQCNILWSVPLGSDYFDSTLANVTVPADGASELLNLAFFPVLSSVDLSAVEDDALTYEYAVSHPELEIIRTVDICGVRYDSTATEFILTEAEISAPDDLAGLSLLNEAATVDMRGELRSLEFMESICSAYPDCTFLFSFNLDDLGIFDFEIDSTITELDISRCKVTDLDLLRRYLNLLPCLTELVMCDCGPSDEDMAILREDYPDVKVVWMLHLEKFYKLRTDAEVFSTLIDGDEPRLTNADCEAFRYCTDLKALDIGHNYVTDLSFLEDLPELRVLIIALNRIDDLSPITNLKYLTYCEAFGNEDVTTLAPFSELSYLRDLNISYNRQATDVEYLYGLTCLERLWMVTVPVNTDSLAELQELLPHCRINCPKYGYAVVGWRNGETYTALVKMFNTGKYDPIFEPVLENSIDDTATDPVPNTGLSDS